MKPFRLYIYLPVVFALVLIAGIWIGRLGNSRGMRNGITGRQDKINSIIDYVQEQYVDTINREQLTDKTIADMLQELDPHSAYMTAEERKRMNEPLEGNFEGIGVEFNIVTDTVRVMNVVTGGPSETAGLLPGDRIIGVDGKPFAAVHMSNDRVLKTLRGAGGTKVILLIRRPGKSKPLSFTITRGTVPLYSVDASYMIRPGLGYIKLSRFAATSYDEYMTAFTKLKSLGLKKLILDLRGNGGGYLNIAVSIADEFLPKGKLIVYTKGRAVPHGGKRFVASSRGEFEESPLILLIDENSASASEIIAGAVQDNDRGLIVGRRSFGKGLVQEERDLPDGSAFRLTIARYYTPSGRCIQRPYKKGSEEYYQDETDRYKRGELLNADSIRFSDSLKFKTPGGKTVYGGGGIMPDVFVPLDTTEHSRYINELIFRGIIRDFVLDYADANRSELVRAGFDNYKNNFVVTPVMLKILTDYGAKNGIRSKPGESTAHLDYLAFYVKATLARILWNEEDYYIIYNTRDKALQKAILEASR